MPEQKRVYRWYLILAIIYSSISILIGVIFFKPNILLPLMALWGPIVLIWFIFNIVMLVLFITRKVEKTAIWLPSLYIFDQIFSGIVGLIFGAIGVSKGLSITETIQSPIMFILSMIFPIIILVLAIKLITRKN